MRVHYIAYIDRLKVDLELEGLQNKGVVCCKSLSERDTEEDNEKSQNSQLPGQDFKPEFTAYHIGIVTAAATATSTTTITATTTTTITANGQTD
jgi:hypothetical protein